ncbi:MAG: (d)CMP kinase [Proteobacteria bacterium]|nr:(d)CMP kinase [Pseudomonadota bacterium]
MVIAIDGPGGVGKSTVARAVARELALAYLDTGATYRAATVAVLAAGIEVADCDAILREVTARTIDYGSDGITLDGVPINDEVRSPGVTADVSAVSAHAPVRTHIVEIQRSWVDRHGGNAVVEGRDIGTVVFPNADVKVFLTARPEVRAARRAGDSESTGTTVSEIASALAARDNADSSRAASPLRPADDAIVIDTSDIDIGAVIDLILELVAGLHVDGT